MAAERIAAAARAGGSIALAGGSTPRAAYERLAVMRVDWSACVLWFGDERCVPPDDERSNFRMVREALLDRLTGPGPAVRRIPGELGPEAGAAAYDKALREAFGGSPLLDLVLLGIGADGHCASLFPGDSALEERKRLAVGVSEPGLAPLVPRVTLTLPAINSAREVFFLATGAEKAGAVSRVSRGPDRALPASFVAPASGTVTWLLDPAAAGR